jgi:hypothetical protein
VRKGREEENLCMKCFVAHLEKSLESEKIEYGRDKDPPDFWCMIDNKKYAVEVTRIVYKLVKTSEQMRSIDFPLYRDWLKKLAKKIEEKAKEGKFLRGGYVINTVGTPEIPHKNEEMVSEAIEYICKTSNLSRERGLILLSNQRNKIEIIKVNNNKDYVTPSSSLGKSEGKIKRELEILLENRIAYKINKLKKPNVPKYDGTILIIRDCYIFGERDDFPQAVEGMEYFHAVFLVLNVSCQQGYFLYTKDNSWCTE